MSVVVMGMEIPENCAECKLKTWTNTDPYCTAIQSKLEWNKYSSGSWVGIDKRCPLRPLPEKHGRLGDLDELKTSFADSINECKKWIKELEENGDNETLVLANQAFCTFVEAALRLKSIPTIVEAEGE